MVVVDESVNKTKSPNDDKLYRHVTLENGLQCLLISSLNSKRSPPPQPAVSIMNDRRISARHTSVALIRNSVALVKDYNPPTFKEVEADDEIKEPPPLPARIKKYSSNIGRSRRSRRSIGAIRPTSQRISVQDRRSRVGSVKHQRDLIFSPGNISRISLFSDVKPLMKRSSTNYSVTHISPAHSHDPDRADRKKITASFRPHSTVVNGSMVVDIDEMKPSVRAKMAAVSLAVAVGSFAEPKEFNGLAHFLEHMLFMGSKKFPEENAFDKFLNKVGGASNAYTDSERTVYHFNCPQENLKEALDIFSQFFISPLLLPESGMRELESIEEEFALRTNDDECRLLELWRYTSREGTPFSQFTCGNSKTLLPSNDDGTPNLDVFEALREFHSKYYVGENMRLVIQSGDKIDSLQNIVLDLFDGVRSAAAGSKEGIESIVCPDFSDRSIPWRIGMPNFSRILVREHKLWNEIFRHDVKKEAEVEPGVDGAALGCIFRMIPLQDTHELVLSWQLPPQAQSKKNRPTDYITSLLGHACEGSVFSETRKRGWVTALSATCCTMDGFEDNSVCTLLKVTIVLTRQGFDQWTYVAGMVFEYIGILLREPLREWVMEELVQIYKAQYDYAEESDAQLRVQDLSVCMLPQWGYSPETLLDMGLHHELEWNPDAVLEILNLLRPELVRVDLSSSIFRADEYSEARAGSHAFDKVTVERIGARTKQEEDSPSVNAHSHSWNNPLSHIRKRIKKRPSKTQAHVVEEVVSQRQDALSIMNQALTRPPLIEPFTEMAFWADRIPSIVRTMWQNLFKGEFTVVAERSMSTEESDANALTYPPRNKYMATDFTCREGLKDYTHDEKANWLTNCEFQIRHDPSTDPSPKTKQNNSTMFEIEPNPRKAAGWKVARAKYVDVERNMIIVEYENGLHKWHKLGENFFNDYGKVLKDKFTPAETSGAHLAVKDDASSHEQDQVKNVVKFSLDKIHLAKLRTTKFSHDDKPVFTPTNVETGLENLAKPSSHSFREYRDKFLAQFPEVLEADKDKVPVLVAGSDNVLSMWHFQDEEYRYPRAEVRCRILSPMADATSWNAALNDLLSLMVTEAIRDEVYLAQVAELEVSVKSFEYGQNINLYGFSHKLPRLLLEVFRCFRDFAVAGADLVKAQQAMQLGSRSRGTRKKATEAKIKKLKAQAKESIFKLIDSPVFYAQLEALSLAYCNENNQFQSSGALTSAMYRVLVKAKNSPESKASSAESIEPALLAGYAATFLKKCKIEILVCGNVSVAEAEEMATNIRELVSKVVDEPLSAQEVPKFEMIDVPICKVVPSKDEWHALSGLLHPLEAQEFPGHSVDLYFHIGEDDLKTRVLIELIEHIMREPLYRDIRTKQQLAYMVKCSAVSLYGKLGYVIELTSAKHGPQFLAQDVDNFLLKFRAILAEMPMEDFYHNVAALARRKLEHPRGFSQVVDRHWETIRTSYNHCNVQYMWNSLYREVDLLKNFVTPEMLISKYDECLLPTSETRRRVSVVVFGHGHGLNPLRELTQRKHYIKLINGAEENSNRPRVSQTGQGICVII